MITDESIMQENIYPSKITFSGRYVEFERAAVSATGTRLLSFSVKDPSGSLVRKVTFNQVADPDGELTLNGLTVSGSGSQTENWSFRYNGSAPPRFTRDLDRWGYYNAAGNTTLVPTVTTDVVVNRYPYLGFTASVTFTTGKKLEYIYAPIGTDDVGIVAHEIGHTLGALDKAEREDIMYEHKQDNLQIITLSQKSIDEIVQNSLYEEMERKKLEKKGVGPLYDQK